MIIVDANKELFQATKEYRERIGDVINTSCDLSPIDDDQLQREITQNFEMIDQTKAPWTYYLTYPGHRVFPEKGITQAITHMLSLLSPRRNPERPILVLIPQLSQFPFSPEETDLLELALRVFRKHGIQMLFTDLGFEQLEQRFPSSARMLIEQLSSLIVLNAATPETAHLVSKRPGCPLSADEILQLPETEMIVHQVGMGWYRGKKTQYFRDARFRK
jgi:hypothetical protein